MKIALVVVSGAACGERFDIDHVVTRIGRHPDSDIVVRAESASAHHAELTFDPSGAYIVDRQSRNGTTVNGERVTRRRLGDGDEICIGDTVFRFTATTVGEPPVWSEQPSEFDGEGAEEVVLDGRRLRLRALTDPELDAVDEEDEPPADYPNPVFADVGATAGIPQGEVPPRWPGPPTMGELALDILLVPFRADFLEAGMILTCCYAAVHAGVVLNGGIAAGFLHNGAPGGAVAAGLVGVAIMAATAAWFAQRMVQVVELYDSTEIPRISQLSSVVSLEIFLTVAAIAYLPAVFVALHGFAGGSRAMLHGPLIGCVAWGWLYFPMGFGMAAAYGALNPIKVISRIVVCFPLYLLVQVYAWIVTIVSCLLAGAIATGLLMAASGFWMKLSAMLVGVFIIGTAMFYSAVCSVAMVGSLLRGSRQRIQAEEQAAE